MVFLEIVLFVQVSSLIACLFPSLWFYKQVHDVWVLAMN